MSKVVVVKYIGDQRNRPLTLSEYEMFLTAALRALSDQSNLTTAVHRYLPGGTVGMKANCLVHQLNSTPLALADALTAILINAGFKEKDVVVWERSNRELASAGFTLNVSGTGRRCVGTDANAVGYSEDFYGSGEVNSLVSRILTEIVDVNVNLPVLKDHSVAGLSAGMKNMYGAINNPNKYHGNNCDPYCAHVNNLEPIRSKNRLTVIDAVRVQYNGGPGYAEDHLAYYNGLVISDDPVAADRIGLEILEHLRAINGQPTLERAGRPVRYLASAEKLGLGIANIKKIELRVIMIDKNGRESTGELLE
ncbi:MAG: DUF362 domain-containing protein [Candidatus Zixiibacteriota bacterium]|nr:MAG: DUF362 domain-containing protein [candidate division Zixibacteria bacterium]